MTSDTVVDRTTIPIPAASVAHAELDAEAVLFHADSGDVHVLNPTASVIWQRFDGSSSIDTITAGLADTFAVDPGTVLADVVDLTSSLLDLGLLVEGPIDGSPAEPADSGMKPFVEDPPAKCPAAKDRDRWPLTVFDLGPFLVGVRSEHDWVDERVRALLSPHPVVEVEEPRPSFTFLVPESPEGGTLQALARLLRGTCPIAVSRHPQRIFEAFEVAVRRIMEPGPFVSILRTGIASKDGVDVLLTSLLPRLEGREDELLAGGQVVLPPPHVNLDPVTGLAVLDRRTAEIVGADRLPVRTWVTPGSASAPAMRWELELSSFIRSVRREPEQHLGSLVSALAMAIRRPEFRAVPEGRGDIRDLLGD